MLASGTSPAVCFVWQPADLDASTVEIHKAGEAGIIVDLSGSSILDLHSSDRRIEDIDIKISLEQFFQSSTHAFIKERGVRTVWLEYFTELLPCHFDAFIDRLKTYGICNIITGDISFITSFCRSPIKNCGLALKGSEASGFVGSEATLTLVSLVERLAAKYAQQPSITIWGAVATPEAAAALLASGIRSIVFESLHWLTESFVRRYPTATKKIAQLRVEHSSLVRISPRLFFRAFNKGKSQALKEIVSRENNTEDPVNKHAVSVFSNTPIHGLRGDFDGRQILPIGIEAAFAGSFQQRFGEETKTAIATFSKKVEQLVAQSSETLVRFFAKGITQEMGIGHPFIQGAMACITDVPAFAVSIARAGGLPTIAFGMQDPEKINEKYAALQEQLEGYPYAINIIALPENPFREAQLAWILKNPPPFVVISAGDPSFAVQLQEHNIRTIFVTSDVDLLRLAWKRGIKYVVCEGHEAGGHVGELSMLTLAQTVLEMKRKTPEIAAGERRLILAGGIFDRMSLFRAASLGADAVQMGTAYLATTEIVSDGALTGLYQKLVLDSDAGDTTITGESIGLRVRSLLSPKIVKIQQIEKEYGASGANDSSVRKVLEQESGGSLYKAARGLDPYTGQPLTEQECYTQGQYMSGAVAGMLTKAVSVADFHEQLAQKELEPILKKDAQVGEDRNFSPRTDRQERIAITGVAMANALGNDPEEVWQSCIRMKSGISRVPVSRWDHDRYFSRSGNYTGKTYCEVGAFLALDISRKDLGISPHDFRTMTDSTKLTLWLARKAIEDSGILSSAFSRDRVGVIISQNSGEMGSTAEDLTLCVNAKEIAQSIQKNLALEPGKVKEIEESITAGRISIDDTTLLGRLNCTAGGFICNTYGITGPSYSVSAACATGLVALYSAIQLIRNDVLDAAIVGGGEELLHPASYLEFSALGALAGKTFQGNDPAAASRPFDRDRDGMVLGEGGAVLVIERESLAIGRKKKIYASITGIGASNNHRGMVESVAETQQLAINASFRDARYGPDQVDMVECHATATPTGDIEEVKALKAVFPRGNPVVLSSFKSQIGHTLGTSGLNSLIQGIWAMRSGLYPPTLNYQTPDPRVDLESWGFRVCSHPEIWPYNPERPRRFQVNAFGFGGANYVVQLEEADWTAKQGELAGVGQQTMHPETSCTIPSGPIRVGYFRTTIENKNYRIGTLDSTGGGERISSILQRHISSDGSIQPKKLGKEGLILADAAEVFPLGFMFAGQGTHYSRMGLELFNTFPTIRYWMEKIAELADFDILHMLFQERETNLRKTVWQQPALFVLEYALYQQLHEFNLKPVALVGHSMGELTALAVAGCFSYEDAFRIICKRAACMEKAGNEAIDPGAMIAVDAPEEILDGWITTDPNLFYTNFNSPHQTVIGGGSREIEALKGRLDDLKYWNHILPVSMAFHSPLMRIIRDDLGDYLTGIDFQPPRIPVISNTTRMPYPDDPAAIREIIISHLESPVHWRSNITTLWEDFGVRFFVEIGPQDTLCRLLNDIIPEAEGMHTCYPGLEAESLRKTIAGLFAKGHIIPAEPPEYLDLHETANRKERSCPVRNDTTIREIIQREINLFALDGVERYLLPAMVKAIQREVDPSFQRHELDGYLGFGRSGSSISTGPALSAEQSVKEKTAQMSGPAAAPLSPHDDILEKVIGIIMDATGYERSELAPNMDIRQDLSIRSSRLPIIMDAAEQTFNIVIKLEEFMDVRTIGDFAERVAESMKSQGASPGKIAPDRLKGAVAIEPLQQSGILKEAFPVKRMVFRRREVVVPPPQPVMLSPGGHVLILTLGAEDYIPEARVVFEDTFTCSITHLRVSSEGEQPGTIDLRAAEKAQATVRNIADTSPLTGLVFLSHLHDEKVLPLSHVSAFCTGLFALLQVLLQSGRRAFCVHISREHGHNAVADMLAGGILGIFLTAKMEYRSMLFRSLRDGLRMGIQESLNLAIDGSLLPMDLVYEEKMLCTNYLCREPLPFSTEVSLSLGPDDVLLISGGGRGITSFLARALAARGCRLILLGRSEDHSAETSGDVSDREAQAGSEIKATLDALGAAGVRTEYIRCDVGDRTQVTAMVNDVLTRYGRIDGIVHGAGILRDGFIQLLTVDDFQKVLTTKFVGIVNLVEACGGNLRFIVGFSSIAAITGNVGQANYCCANRIMAAYISSLRRRNHRIIAKTFWLPPIEGVGMAEDPDLKEIIKIKVGDNAFLGVSEISGIIVKELMSGPEEECWVVPVRQLPEVPSVLVEEADLPLGNDWYDCRHFPLLDRVLFVDATGGLLHAERAFSCVRDLWLNDHKPFPWLSRPIVSAIMIVETFLEAALLSFPHLLIKQVEKVQFSRMLECPADQDVKAHIFCRAEKMSDGDVSCHVAFGKAAAHQPADGLPGKGTYFSGQVIMTETPPEMELPKIHVETLAEDTGAVMSREDVLRYYQERSGLTGRYRVLEHISAYAPRSILGRMVYPEVRDFSSPMAGSYLYPLYLLEGLIQLVGFHAGIREKDRPRAMVPAAIESLGIFQKCAAGDVLLLVGQLQAEDRAGILWDAKGYTNGGNIAMRVDGLRMNWLD